SNDDDDDDDDDGGASVDVAPGVTTPITPENTPPSPDFDISQVTELPRTGETPWWRDWVVYGGSLMLVVAAAGAITGAVLRRKRTE
ncbi:MAG: hypothetical protein AAFR22_18410, partial [Chloroflexota bacterium]